MKQIISQEKAQKLAIIKGRTRGVVIKPDIQFILRERGQEGLDKVKTKMRELGTSLDLENLKTAEMYPLGIRTIFLLVAKQVLDFSDEDIKEMGKGVPKHSSIIRFFMRSFILNRKRFFQKAPAFWERFVTIGKVKVSSFSEEEKRVVVQMKEFNVDPVFCPYIEGVFSSFVKIITGAKKIVSRETKCSFQGDDYHEFVLEW